MTNYLDIEHLLMFNSFVNRSFLQIYRKQNKENEKQNKNLRGMYSDKPEIEYSYRLRVFIRQIGTSSSELIVIFSLAKMVRKKVRESRIHEFARFAQNLYYRNINIVLFITKGPFG